MLLAYRRQLQRLYPCFRSAIISMASYSSSIQPGSLVTHPSLYANKSREELLARIAELERLQARQILSTSQEKTPAAVGIGSTSSAAPAIASSSSTTLDHPPSSASTSTSTNGTATPLQSKHERKLLKKQARLTAPTGRDGNTGTGALQGEDFFARYGSRKIALRFCYEGWLYGGLALQNDEPPSGILPVRSSTSSAASTTTTAANVNALPTVEGVLLDALVAARLIKESDKRDLDRLDFSRCGRTDRGVSAAGQVISLYVRSQLREEEGTQQPGWRSAENPPVEVDISTLPEEERKKAELKKNKPRPELPYMSLLNRVLPNSIRILGWSPVDESFDSRFSCKHRHYKYFFTAPSAGSSKSRNIHNSKSRRAGLDIKRMQDAANRLVGEHDFRNLCKVDATKQITNFYRYVMSATISPVSPPRSVNHNAPTNEEDDSSAAIQDEEDMYVFDLKGSAFLYHQVRHIMAVLFLVGSGHEEPSVVDALLNTGYTNERPILEAQEPSVQKMDLPLVASRPAYEMAADLPLVLWDCAFAPEAGLKWRQDELIEGDDLKDSKGYLEMKQAHTQLRIKEAISSHFMRAYLETGQASASSASFVDQAETAGDKEKQSEVRNRKACMFEIPLGGGKTARAGKYTPLLERPRSDSVEVVNERWASGQGKRRAERKAREQAEGQRAVEE